MEGWELTTYVVVAAALAAGGLTKGFTGIGLPLLAVPLMSMVIDVTLAVALMPIPILVTNIWQTFTSTYLRSALKRFWLLLVCIPVGTVLGVKVLSSADPRLLRGIIGSIVIVFSLVTQFQPNWHLREALGKKISPLVGFSAGIIGGISSFFAPPLVMFLMALQVPKEAFVGAIGLMYLVGVIPMIGSLAFFNVMAPADFLVSGFAALPVFVGQLLGHTLRHRIDELKFRRVVLGVLLLTGLNLIRRAFQ